MPGVGPARRPRRSDIAVRVRTFVGLQARHHLGLPVLLEDLSNALLAGDQLLPPAMSSTLVLDKNREPIPGWSLGKRKGL